MIRIKTKHVIDVQDFNNLVQWTYGRVYNFQQQDGCKDRQLVDITVPVDDPLDYENDTIPEEVNGDEMGVSFVAWLARDPKQKLDTDDVWDREYGLAMFWGRNFYPSVEMVINDLYARGLLPAGNYSINIDW